MRIAVAGRGPLADAAIRALAASSYSIAALLWNGRRTNAPRRAFIRLTESLHHPIMARTPVVWLDRMDNLDTRRLARRGIDLLVSCGLDRILSPAILAVPRLGCINIHPSLLPRHRGPNPLAHVVLSGDRESGITYHWMEEGIDTGPIIAQFRHPVDARDSGRDLAHNACLLTEKTLARVLGSLAREESTPQAASNATYAGWLSDEQLTFDWKWPACDIDRLIRAAQPFACARFRFGKKNILVERADFDTADACIEPGTVLRSGPHPIIAAKHGSIAILRARVEHPFRFPWPAPWNAPKQGDRIY